MKIVDFHTHAFPDSLAARAVSALEAEADITAVLDGTVGSLLASMDKAGIDTSVVASIATKPAQFAPILEWSLELVGTYGGRLVPFPSVHPEDPDAVLNIRKIAERGFSGIKLHPYYQEFRVDEARMMPVYETIAAEGLILLLHTGFDIAFPRDRLAAPEQVRRVLEGFPGIRMVTSHLGAWEDWDEVERLLLRRPVFMDISASIEWMGAGRARRFLTEHPREYLLFGSDSPWDDQASLVRRVMEMDLPRERLELLFHGNAERLLTTR